MKPNPLQFKGLQGYLQPDQAPVDQDATQTPKPSVPPVATAQAAPVPPAPAQAPQKASTTATPTFMDKVSDIKANTATAVQRTQPAPIPASAAPPPQRGVLTPKLSAVLGQQYDNASRNMLVAPGSTVQNIGTTDDPTKGANQYDYNFSERGPATGGTGFVNLNRYMDMNRSQGAQMANALAGKLQKQADGARKALEDAKNQFYDQLGFVPGQDIDEHQLAQMPGYAEAKAKIDAAQQAFDQAQKGLAGMQSSTGWSAFDAAVAGGSGNSIQNQAEKNKDLGTDLDAADKATQSAQATQQAEAQKVKANMAEQQQWSDLTGNHSYGQFTSKPGYNDSKMLNQDLTNYGVSEKQWSDLNNEQSKALLKMIEDPNATKGQISKWLTDTLGYAAGAKMQSNSHDRNHETQRRNS